MTNNQEVHMPTEPERLDPLAQNALALMSFHQQHQPADRRGAPQEIATLPQAPGGGVTIIDTRQPS